MDYSFGSCLVDSIDPPLVASIQGRWTRLHARRIWFPFKGYVFRFPDRQRRQSDGNAEAILEQQRDASLRISEISAKHPDVNFLWIEVDRVGDTGLYSGYHCRNGRTICTESEPNKSPARLFVSFAASFRDDQWVHHFTRGLSWFS